MKLKKAVAAELSKLLARRIEVLEVAYREAVELELVETAKFCQGAAVELVLLGSSLGCTMAATLHPPPQAVVQVYPELPEDEDDDN